MIGILAGMGPKSTGPFVDKVVDECQRMYGATYDMDFPHMMIYSCPTPFFIDQPINHAEMEAAIIKGARKLEQTGVDFIAIPCNTAHIYFQQLQHSVSVPLLNMIDETIKAIPGNSKKIALLATDPTVQSGIFQDAFLKNGLDYIHKDHWQTCVNQIIQMIKTSQIDESVQLWKTFSKELTEEIDAAVIACTDLNVVTDQQSDIRFIDSSACLAKAIVHKYLSLTGR
ncbi:amino acid racemase [Bacillus glycinifermentans]|uniref:Amino acid racemase n=1 Tax=Bacillus glycinifermentans TaxID=1664069 RepID=A0A0J6H3M0_9BACI|nr:amino acid racemase [Bacillus glycinifermentans]ATH94176.1 amino-acid racemase [Bacillus glycinifermentans]KMM62822.1 amino acid racemase [Bacillus glycinifermentans]KRT95599.1 amino acid racemase [Bacillus glycinifermentans]MEC0484525.1 amino acid racemase [Bacillus glycinifermentans]MEC0496916.1 amino acid racemase [Bacillus glycinifermentans]